MMTLYKIPTEEDRQEWERQGQVHQAYINLMVSLTTKNNALVEALTALKHHNDDCWCDMAIGNPNYLDHSDACKKAKAALAQQEKK